FDGYTVDEKTAIARDYLWPRQRERNGLRDDEVAVGDDVIQLVVSEYTREAGVRQLERELGTILRKTATRIASDKVEPPVAVGVDRVVVRPLARRGARDRARRVQRPDLPRARAGGRNPEGRAERGHHDVHGARVAALRPPGEAHRGHDGRGDAAGPRAPDRRA